MLRDWSIKILVLGFCAGVASPAHSASIQQPPPAQLESIAIYAGGFPWKAGDSIKLTTQQRSLGCLASPDTEDDPNTTKAPAEIKTSIIEVNNITQYSDAMQIGAYASVFGYAASVTNTTSFSTSSSSDQQHTQLVIQIQVAGKTSRLKSLQLSSDALKLLQDGPSVFALTCGDAFISDVEYGSQLSITFSFDNSTDDVKTAVEDALSATYGVSKGGLSLQQTLENYRHLTNLKIDGMQAGGPTDTTMPLGSNDPVEWLQYAVAFLKSATAPVGSGLVPSRVHFTKYTDVASIAVALAGRAMDFDDSYAIMKSIVESYQLARDRQTLVASALSSSDDFIGQDATNRPLLEKYQADISVQVKKYADAATQCSDQIKQGKQCTTLDAYDILPLPDIQPIICSLTAVELTAQEGCTKRSRIGKACYCTDCIFHVPANQAAGSPQSPSLVPRMCYAMKPGLKATVIYNGTLSLPKTNAGISNIAYRFNYKLGQSAGSGATGNDPSSTHDFNAEEIVTVPDNGTISAAITLYDNYANSGQNTVTVEPQTGGSYYIDVHTDTQ